MARWPSGTSAPGGNHNHRELNKAGRLLFLVRPHPQEPARANGLAYAGLQWYGQCWGGNELRYTQVGAQECNTPCPSGQICGEAWRNSIYATGNTPPPPGGGMQADSAVRGCSDWTWWSPVYQPDPGACYNHCAQNGANSCEWNVNGDCYVEFASGGCSVQGGFPGWWSAVF